MALPLASCNCTQCNRTFWIRQSDLKRGRGKHCSKQCYFIHKKQGQSKKIKSHVCAHCKKLFTRYTQPNREVIYCSNKCSHQAKTKHKDSFNCLLCGVLFYKRLRPCQIKKGSKIKYCSEKCKNASRRKPEGTKKPTKCGRSKSIYTYIKYKGRWIREAVAVAEQILGRRLSKSERIVYLDGDKTNKSVDNIVVTDRGKRITKCKKCGLERLTCRWHTETRNTDICRRCSMRDMRARQPRIINKDQIGCIKYLRSIKLSHTNISLWFQVSQPYINQISLGKVFKEVAVMSSKKAWEVLMQQHDKLAKEGRISLYDRIKLLMQIESNPNFGRNCLQNGCQPVSVLDGKVKDTCANFTELKAMMKLFPKKEQWEGGDIGLMKQQTIQMIQSQKKEEKGDQKNDNRERVTKAMYHLLQEENARLKQEIEHLKSELSLAKEMIETLKGQSPRKTKRA